jgi:hypothetical protein
VPEDPSPYRRDAFYQMLSEVQGRFTELRYIDRAADYLEGEQAQWYHHQPVGSHVVMEIPFGQTAPFTRTYQIGLPTARWPWEELPWHSSREEEVNERLAELAEEAGTWAVDNIGALKTRIDQLTYPSPAIYEYNVIAPLEEANWVLDNLVRTDFDKLGYSIAHWDGTAAENYVTNFHNPFEDTRDSHSRLIGALAGGVVTAKAIVEATQHSLMNVVHHTSNLLYQQLVLRSQDTVQDSTATALVLGAGVASIAGAIANPGLWAVGWEAVAAGFSLASTRIPADAAISIDLFGRTAEQLLESLDTAIGTIEAGMVDQYDALADQLVNVQDHVELLRDHSDGEDGRLVPGRPILVDGVDSDTFLLS